MQVGQTQQGYRTFLLIWLGQVVSTLGSGLTGFAIGVWIYDKTHSATLFTFSAMFVALPGILFSPLAGALVDRWDRRVAMLISDTGAGVSSLLLALLALSGHLSLPALFGLMALGSLFTTLSWPAFSAATSLLVPKEQLGRANGLAQGGEAAAMIVTPILGALMFTRFGLGPIAVLDVVSFLFAITALLIVRVPRPAATLTTDQTSLLTEASFGWHYIRLRPALLSLVCFFLLINFAGGISNVLITPMVISLYNEKTLGAVLSTAGIGMLAGTILMGAWGGPKRRVYGIYVPGLVSGIALILVGLLPRVSAIATGLFVVMLTAPIMNACSQAIWQTKVDADIQGRVFAVRRMIAWFVTPLAFLVSGPLADRVFEPALKPGGSLTHSVGTWLGTGPGAGMRFMFVLLGLVTILICAAYMIIPRLRMLEDQLTDATLDAEPLLSH